MSLPLLLGDQRTEITYRRSRLRQGAESDGLVQPSMLANRYGGPVFVLIGPATFSSGMTCALAAKDYGLATIVGEETGEPAETTGEVFSLTTRRLRLPVTLPTVIQRAPKPRPLNEGVVPDIFVGTPSEQRAAGLDPVLERVTRLIGKRQV